MRSVYASGDVPAARGEGPHSVRLLHSGLQPERESQGVPFPQAQRAGRLSKSRVLTRFSRARRLRRRSSTRRAGSRIVPLRSEIGEETTKAALRQNSDGAQESHAQKWETPRPKSAGCTLISMLWSGQVTNQPVLKVNFKE